MVDSRRGNPLSAVNSRQNQDTVRGIERNHHASQEACEATWSHLSSLLEQIHRGNGRAYDDLHTLLSSPSSLSQVLVFLLKQVCEQQDQLAFGLLQEHYEPEIRSYITRMTGNREDTQDLAQETFLRAWRFWSNLGEQDEQKLNFRAWLYRVATNLMHDQRRKETTSPPPSPLPTSAEEQHTKHLLIDSPEHVICTQETLQVVLGQVDPKYRRPLILKEVYGYSTREIAQKLGQPEGTIRANISYGRKQLREAHQQHVKQPEQLEG